MAGTFHLKLSPETLGYARDEIRVIDFETAQPIPFKWLDHETLVVDDFYSLRASVQIRPIPLSVRKRQG